jgi:hypothetical protein
VLQARERAPTPYSSIVLCLGLTFESFKELEVRHFGILWKKLNIIVEKKKLGTPIFKGFMLDNA